MGDTTVMKGLQTILRKFANSRRKHLRIFQFIRTLKPTFAEVGFDLYANVDDVTRSLTAAKKQKEHERLTVAYLI